MNIAELLKHCPRGMELDCTMYEDVYFDYVDELNIIHCYVQNENYKTSIRFNQHGTPNSDIKSKCVIFPKGKTTWEGFQRPFKDGDIVFYNDTIAIFKEWGDETLFRTYVTKYLCCDSLIDMNVPLFGKGVRKEVRFATEEEKAKLFQAIKDNGYEWNSETKTLEKLVEPKFKIGDRIKRKGIDDVYALEIADILQTIYIFKDKSWYSIEYVDKDYELVEYVDKDYELVPLKFDITTLKPFESKVLVRNSDNHNWCPAIFGCKLSTHTLYKYATMTERYYAQCIPYEGNEHLSGTTNDCDNYYKNW